VRKELSECQISLHAGSSVFFLTLSVLPAAALLLGVLNWLPESLIPQIQNILLILPEDIAKLLAALLNVRDPIAVISFSAVIALWTASRGVYGILRGLNRAFHLKETRSWFRIRLSCMADTFLILLLIPLIFYSASILTRFLPKPPVQYLILFAAALLILRILPDHKPTILFLLPGAAFTALSWMVFSRLYRFYLHQLSPGKLTGGLSDAAVTLLWLYFCIELLFWGAMLCRLIPKRNNPQEQ